MKGLYVSAGGTTQGHHDPLVFCPKTYAKYRLLTGEVVFQFCLLMLHLLYFEGIYTCGPAPISAIRKGRIDMQYDTPFVFSEVNADRITWKRENGGWVVEDIQEWA